ncbi:MAG: hypothetical protein R3E66_02275 [bacterium]
MLQRVFQIIGSMSMVSAILFVGHLSQAEDDPLVVGASLAKTGSGSIPRVQAVTGSLENPNAAAGFPALAGMNAAYLERQLLDMKAAKREINPAMKPIIDGLTDGQIRAASTYYATAETQAGAGHWRHRKTRRSGW